MRMLTDNPIQSRKDDKFGFAGYADLLAATILDTDSLPFCIGVFGPWGTGKSSLLQMIREQVETSGAVRTLWFNPWKYDRKEDLWNAMIQTILYGIAESGVPDDVGKKARNLAKSTGWMLLKKAVAGATGGIITSKDIDKLKNAFAAQDEMHYRHINHFERDFQEVVEQFTNGGKLVVFIDDLDRCLPQNAITVLESLKLFIGHAKCVFVLGMDHFVVEQGINHRFGDAIKMSGREYIDKIVQVPFFLPPVRFDALRHSLQVTKSADYGDATWSLLEHGLAGNPRKTKRFVNCYYLVREIMRRPSIAPGVKQEGHGRAAVQPLPETAQDYFVAKLLVFQLQFPEFYALLQVHPEAWRLYEERVLPADSLEARQKIFEGAPGLDALWEDEMLRAFMAKTSGRHEPNFPEAPAAPVVEMLLRAISLVASGPGASEDSERTQGKAMGRPMRKRSVENAEQTEAQSGENEYRGAAF